MGRHLRRQPHGFAYCSRLLSQTTLATTIIKADLLCINIDPDAAGADDEDTDAFNLGGLIDAGYKFGGGEGVFVEPQAALRSPIRPTLPASVWQEFNGGSNDVSIGSPGFPAFGVSDDPGKTVGDVSLGFSVSAPQGWAGFLRGNYQFSDDLEAVAGSAGVRYSW